LPLFTRLSRREIIGNPSNRQDVPKPNLFGTPEGDYVKRAGCLEKDLVNKKPEHIRATLCVFPIRLCPHTLQPGHHVWIAIEVDLE
jgi:hypothetical protein